MEKHSLSRAENLDRVRSVERWDVLVIGGGATGLGTAVDSALRGYRTLLLDSHDFAQATSSRSTKLIHGGVRYLGQRNVPLVRESLHERGLLLRNAPQLVHPRDFVVPTYHYWQLPYYALGLWLYDRLAGKLGMGRSRWVSRGEVVSRVPTIQMAGLRGGIVYTDGQFDDARMAISLARTLTDLGGSALNHMPVTGLIKEGGRIAGARARDAETGEEFSLRALAVVNATGVFADDIRRLDDASAPAMLSPSQGAHIVLDGTFLPGQTAIMVPKTDDGRVLFAIPWHDKVVVGTTDTAMATLPREPRPLEAELEYLLDHAGRYLARAPKREDVKSLFAGLRPLIRPVRSTRGTATSKFSREHAVLVSDSGLVTITGGKWTTYRCMGRDAVDHAARVGGLPGKPCETATLRLHGWDDQTVVGSTLGAYGSDGAGIRELARELAENRGGTLRVSPELSAETLWGIRNEAARSVEDILARRTRLLFLDARAALAVAPGVAALMAEELRRDGTWQADQTACFRRLATGYLPDGA